MPKSIDRRTFLKLTGGGLAALAGSSLMNTAGAAANAGEKPNVVVIVADDLGWGDVSAISRQVVKTPNIDRLGKLGVTCTNGYVTAPLCAPSRAGFLTGMYQQRFGFNNNSGAIPENIDILPKCFREAGYRTALLGKWHAGGPKPHERGFDEVLCYYGPFLNYHQPVLFRNGKEEAHNEYSTDLFAREACEFIGRNRNQPFLLTVAFNAVHILKVVQGAPALAKEYDGALAEGKLFDVPKVPTAPPNEAQAYEKQFPGDKARADTVATIAALDRAVGRIMDQIEQCGISGKTIVFFFSDNGGHPENRSENLPLHEYKWSCYEGGIRVPFFAVYPGVFTPGLRCEQMVSSMDILPTCAALAKVPLPKTVDGLDLAPLLAGREAKSPHEALYFRMPDCSAIREGSWKLVHDKDQTKLYNVEADAEEKNDLAASNPEKVAGLEAKWQAWNKTLAPLTTRKGAGGPQRNGRGTRRAGQKTAA